MKKNLYLLIFTANLLLLTTAHAQLYKIELSEKARAATLITEGKVIAQKCFWNDAHTMIYTSNTVEVYKTFKGRTTESTIEVMTQGGSVGDRAIEVSELLNLNLGQTGIFFCYEDADGMKSPSKHTLYDVYSSDQGFLRYNYANNTASAPFALYKDIENNLYKIIENQTGESKKIVNTSFSISNMLKQNAAASANNFAAGVAAPSITSFSPDIVHGGTLNDPANNLLTITGSGFGNSAGGAAGVLFKSGNDASSDPTLLIPYDSAYIVSWTDIKILVKVPSGAATGKIGVVLNNGFTKTISTQTLTVTFSVLNFYFDIRGLGIYDTTFVSEPRLINTNNKGGYDYSFSTNTAGQGIDITAGGTAAAVRRAVDSWKEIVGANLAEGATTSVQKIKNDGVNAIMYDNKNTGVKPMAAGVLEATYSYGNIVCYNPTPFVPGNAIKTGFDILLRNPSVSQGAAITFVNGPCFPQLGASTFDLENIAVHEVGHALNLAHINDDYEVDASFEAAHANPGKIMHYSIQPYVDRRSLDDAAYSGGHYTVTPQDLAIICKEQMSPLDVDKETKDECPATFPATASLAGTTVNFDLAHTTSNKHKDPAFTQINGQNTGVPVTNNAYYAIKTAAFPNGTLSINISDYATTPASLAGCAGQGIRLAVYQVNACPVGQQFPAPVATATFTGNGNISNITGLAANTNYLLYFDGIRNTKASFKVTFGGSALPIVLSKFTGEYIHGIDNLYIDILQAINVKNIAIEKSADGSSFVQIGTLNVPSAQLAGKHTYIDAQPLAGKNYYRLKVIDNDGHNQYSNILVLQNTLNQATYVYPNPAKSTAYVSLSGTPAGRYNFVLYNIAGKAILSNIYMLNSSNQTISLPITGLASGMYIVRIVNVSGKTVAQQKLIKN